MKKMIISTLITALFLCACGRIQAEVPDNPAFKATQALVEKYKVYISRGLEIEQEIRKPGFYPQSASFILC